MRHAVCVALPSRVSTRCAPPSRSRSSRSPPGRPSRSPFPRPSHASPCRCAALLCAQNEPQDLTSRGRAALHGNGTDRWCDKSVTFVIFRNGLAALHAEHAWGDAPVAAHCMEYIMLNGACQHGAASCRWDVPPPPAVFCPSAPRCLTYPPRPTPRYTEAVIDNPYDEQGDIIGYAAAAAANPRGRDSPKLRFTKLRFHIDDDLAAAIDEATASASAAIANLDLLVTCQDSFGKGFMKSVGVSPDGFIQMALQLAYFKCVPLLPPSPCYSCCR